MKKKIIATFAALMFLSVGSAAHAQHYVQKNETLAKIAKEYKMKLPDLISLNPHIKNPNHIVPGDYIVIRTESEKAADLIDYAKSLQYTTAYAYGGQELPFIQQIVVDGCKAFIKSLVCSFPGLAGIRLKQENLLHMKNCSLVI